MPVAKRVRDGKVDQAGIYTEAEVDQCATAYVKGKGNNALTAGLGPGKKRFQDRHTSAGYCQALSRPRRRLS